MKRCFVAPLVLFAASVAFTQAQPTVKQCRADREAWGFLTGEDMNKAPFVEIDRRANEIGLCGLIDATNRSNYVSFTAVLEREEKRRMFMFIDRHGYWKQFLQEDGHGER